MDSTYDTAKPDRAHFCRQLNRNVLKFDHYCPWIGNAVGLKNYKYFLLTMFYGSLLLLQKLLIILYYLYHRNKMTHIGTTYLQLLALQILLPLTIVIGLLLIFHLMLLFRNMTTIEYIKSLSNKHYIHNYDRGMKTNVINVFGNERKWRWLLPVTPLQFLNENNLL